MKQTTIVLVAIFAFSLSSCASLLFGDIPESQLYGKKSPGKTDPAPKTIPIEYDISVTSDSGSGLLEISALSIWVEAAPLAIEGTKGFLVAMKNTSSRVVSIVWEKSSVFYNGTSNAPFIQGQKYSEATKPMSPMIIPPGETVKKEIYSSRQPFYLSGQSGGWVMLNMSGDKITILLFAESGDKSDYYTITATKR